jgi:hypothetical protein
MCKLEGKTPLANTPWLLGPNGLSMNSSAGMAKRAGAGEARPDHRRKFRWDLIFEIQMNLNFGKTLRISTRIFRRNLDMEIIHKFL